MHRSESGQAVLAEVIAGLVVVLLVVGVFIGLIGWPFAKTPQDKVCISYGAGPIEGEEFQRVIEPGSGIFLNGLFDNLYCYPVTQRTYSIDARDEAADEGAPDSITAFTDDRVQAKWEVVVYFKLCQEPDCISRFHREIGKKTEAYTDEGWVKMLNEYFLPQITNVITRESRRFTSAQIADDEQSIVAVQDELGRTLKENVSNVVGGEYFCSPEYTGPGDDCLDLEVIVKKPSLPENVVNAFERNLTSEIDIETKNNEVKQREAEARAIEELNKALEASGPSYVLLKAIESGKIDFWVLPGGNNLNLTAPSRGGQ